MAFALVADEVGDLTLGKPPLPRLAVSSCSVRDALCTLHDCSSHIGVWNCPDHTYDAAHDAHTRCQCLGKICKLNIICYLAAHDTLSNPALALAAPVSVLLSEQPPCTVQHVPSHASLLDALDLIVAGAQNLVVPIPPHASKNIRSCATGSSSENCLVPQSPKSQLITHGELPKSHNGREYCWLTQDDVLRFLLGRISIFSPLPMRSIEELGIVNTDVMMVEVEEPACSALEMIKAACLGMTAVAVVENVNDRIQLVGEISCSTLQTCNETAALALATLSARDFLLFIQHSENPPEVLASIVRSRIRDKVESMKGKPGVVEEQEMWEEESSDEEFEEESSDEEFRADSPTGPHDLSQKWFSGNPRGSGRRNRSAPICCRPRSSLIAVILQALAHRQHHVWVIADENALVGIVTLLDILTVLSN